jgi:UDP-N-acetylmuramate dehydrogenase
VNRIVGAIFVAMSISIEKGVSLKHMNTFGLEVAADQFCRFRSVDMLRAGLEKAHGLPKLILGGGSNILFTSDFQGMVLKNEIGEIQVVQEDEDFALVEAGAGVVWHDLVRFAVEKGWGGIENMSLIPGSCGAAPMQNIGAYGVEVKDCFQSLKAYHIASSEIHEFDGKACEFAYRESVFKRKLKGQYVILSVCLRLNKKPSLNTSYGAIELELETMGLNASVKTISDAVIRIRRSKLPDPAVIGNAGSFFKNPVVEDSLFQKLIGLHPSMPNYPAESGKKLAAGWLIEQCGWKGKDLGGYGVHDKQALVLVNRGQGSGEKLYALSEEIILSVKEKFKVEIEREVNII